MREAHKRSRNPKVRKVYRVNNWSEYDRSLRARGDITFWFSEAVQVAMRHFVPTPDTDQITSAFFLKSAAEATAGSRAVRRTLGPPTSPPS